MSQTTHTVSTTLNYLARQAPRPAYEIGTGEDAPRRDLPERDKRSVTINDCRDQSANLSLDTHGFQFLSAATPACDFNDEEAIRQVYYPDVARIVKAATGAADVLVFDHNVRNATRARAGDRQASHPVRFVHNDYTERSAPQRVRDLLPEPEAAERLRGRYAFINFWRPLKGPVVDMPLAVLDAASIAADDFVATDLNYQERVGEVYSVHYNPNHRWHYLSRMQPDDVLLLKCFDSAADGRAQYTAHSAFSDPNAPAEAPTRESIEARTIVFFDEIIEE